MSNRIQFLNINNACSSPKLIEMGVSQGSILDPLLFVIYMKDIFFTSNHRGFILYADDTTLLSPIETWVRIPEWSWSFRNDT